MLLPTQISQGGQRAVLERSCSRTAQAFGKSPALLCPTHAASFLQGNSSSQSRLLVFILEISNVAECGWSTGKQQARSLLPPSASLLEASAQSLGVVLGRGHSACLTAALWRFGVVLEPYVPNGDSEG